MHNADPSALRNGSHRAPARTACLRIYPRPSIALCVTVNPGSSSFHIHSHHNTFASRHIHLSYYTTTTHSFTYTKISSSPAPTHRSPNKKNEVARSPSSCSKHHCRKLTTQGSKLVSPHQHTLTGTINSPTGANMVARHTAPRAAPRGPAATRRAAIKADRDGDLTMGLPVKGRAGVGKGTGPPTGPRIDGANKPGRGGILDTLVQRAILRQASGTRDVAMREERAGSARGGLVELRVTGWNKSKASGDADGGVSSLIRWLEKKASSRLGSRVRNVKIKKVCHRQHADRCIVLCTHTPHTVRPR